MADRRTEILATAYGIMGTKGLEAVHARTVAAEIGINHATVHYYFASRADLLVGIAEYAEMILEGDRERFQEGLTKPRERVENELALAEAYCRRNSRFVKVMAGLYVASLADPALKRRTKGLYTAWSRLFSEQLPMARTRKDSPFTDADLLMATLFGIGLSSHLLDGTNAPLDKIDRVMKSLFQSGSDA